MTVLVPVHHFLNEVERVTGGPFAPKLQHWGVLGLLEPKLASILQGRH